VLGRLVDSTAIRLLGSVLIWSWILVWGTLLAVAGLLLFLPFNPWVDPQRRMMERLNWLWGRGAFWAAPGITVELVGGEWLKANPGPYVICANHASVTEIPLLLSLLPPLKTIAKAPLFWTPPLGLQMRLAGHIPAGRGEAGDAERVVEHAKRWLGRGVHILVFPEGTRSPDGRVQRFGQGPFVLAARAGVPVLPVAISGTHQVLPKSTFLYRLRGHLRVQVLEPVKVEGEPRVVASRVRARIMEALGQQPPRSAAVPEPATPP
jgi:1-acyl-sn-glycerol-3-phosphate acyltransferase